MRVELDEDCVILSLDLSLDLLLDLRPRDDERSFWLGSLDMAFKAGRDGNTDDSLLGMGMSLGGDSARR